MHFKCESVPQDRFPKGMVVSLSFGLFKTHDPEQADLTCGITLLWAFAGPETLSFLQFFLLLWEKYDFQEFLSSQLKSCRWYRKMTHGQQAKCLLKMPGAQILFLPAGSDSFAYAVWVFICKSQICHHAGPLPENRSSRRYLNNHFWDHVLDSKREGEWHLFGTFKCPSSLFCCKTMQFSYVKVCWFWLG